MWSVRSAQHADAASIVSYNCALAQESEDLTLHPEIVARGVARVLSDAACGRYLVVEDEGLIVGQLMVTWEWSDWRDGMFWWIQSVYVAQGHRGRGVFKALFNAAAQLARESGDACGIRLYVERDNAAAQSTYARLGFIHTDYRIMELSLKDAG